MSGDRVKYILTRRGLQRLFRRVSDSGNRAALPRRVPRNQCSIIWTLVVILAAGTNVQPINHVRAREMLLPQMRRAICPLALASDDVERAIAVIARETFAQRAGTRAPASRLSVLCVRAYRVAPARHTVRVGGEGILSIIRGSWTR